MKDSGIVAAAPLWICEERKVTTYWHIYYWVMCYLYLKSIFTF